MLECLERHRVQYVVIGMMAATIHGSPLATIDADICPSRDPGNVDHLADALREMGAALREEDTLGLVNGGPIAVPFECTSAFLLAHGSVQMITRFGELDVVFRPAGTGGYEDLRQRAERLAVRGLAVPVASLEDVIKSKEASDRPKDQRTLPPLRQLLAEIRARTKERS